MARTHNYPNGGSSCGCGHTHDEELLVAAEGPPHASTEQAIAYHSAR